MFKEVVSLPELVGIYLGTRPDCIDEDKLALLASQDVDEIQLDMGLQSSNEITLEYINRGHTAACFAEATEKAAARGLKVCAHVMMGLPAAHLPEGKEGLPELLETVRFLNELPIHGIKFHNTLVGPNTELARMWKKGTYIPMTRDEYMHQISHALAHTRPDIVVQRIQADALPDELLAPMWTDSKGRLIRATNRYLDTFDFWQGMKFDPWTKEVPPWFPEDAEGPWAYKK